MIFFTVGMLWLCTVVTTFVVVVVRGSAERSLSL